MFKTRLISGILLVIAALLTIISGGYVLFFTLLCISLIGMQELYKAMGVHERSYRIVGNRRISGCSPLLCQSASWALKAMVLMAVLVSPDSDHVCLCVYISEI